MGKASSRYTKKRRNPDSGGSPTRARMPGLTEVAEVAVPGFVGFAGSRFLTRVAAVQVGQRAPGMGKHAGAAMSIGTLAALWLLGNRWKWLSKYQTPLVIGSLIATVQSLLQLYFPRLGWVVSDACTELEATGQAPQLATGNPQVANGNGALPPQQQLPAGFSTVNDDPNLYMYDDRYDVPQTSAPAQPAQQQQQAQAQPQQQMSQEDEILAELNLDGSAGLGVFS